jgi:acetyltransferase
MGHLALSRTVQMARTQYMLEKTSWEVRRVRPGDHLALAAFYGRLSPESLRQRFLCTGRGLSEAAARTFCTLDHLHEEGFVAVAPDDDATERVVGHVCLVDAGRRRLEIGICVADELQGRGVGRRLFEVALAWASARDYTSIVATCFATNSRVLGLLGSAPHGATLRAADAGTVEVEIPLAGFSPPRRASWRRTPQPARVAAG